MLIYKEEGGPSHLVFHTSYNGWVTPCQLHVGASHIKHLSYGKPTCFECMLDDKDPGDVGRDSRNCIKLFSEKRGNHVYVVMWMGHMNETLANIGGVTMLEFEWREFRAAVVLGCKQLGMPCILEGEQ
jgi:hypothetical protein